MKTNRRKFIQGLASASAALILPTSCLSDPNKEDQSASPYISKKGKPIKASHDVIVVGAGLSGLHAAMLLEESGYDVQVVEGRERLGGRVYTLENVPGKPEAAGEYIGANYARMINTVNKLGLEMYNPEANDGNNRPWLYRIKGEYITAKNWESHKFNPLEGDDRALLPHRYLSTISHRDSPLIGKPLNAWLEPEFHKYDIPHNQYLRSKGVNEETIKLMNVIIHAGGIKNTSAMNELRRYHVMNFSQGKLSFPDGTGWKMVKGGNSLLPRAMAESLNNDVHLGKTVVSFTEEDGLVHVNCADGSHYTGKHVVCSMPITVLKNVTFKPNIEGILHQAINQMDYGLSIQAHFIIKEPFWEQDGLDMNMWTDGPLERFAVRTKKDPNDPWAGLAFINGPESLKFRLMSDEQVFDYVEAKLAEIRPASKGKLERLMIQSCERDMHGAGDWVVWQPGQVKKFANHMRTNHGNIHFAGEHTAIMERGMEGAFESGERAALDIILKA